MAGTIQKATLQKMLDNTIKNASGLVMRLKTSNGDKNETPNFDSAVQTSTGAYIDLFSPVVFENLLADTTITDIELRDSSGLLASWDVSPNDTLANPGSYTVEQFFIEIDVA